MWGKLWKDPVWSTVIATGIIAAVGGLGAYLLGYWPTISHGAYATWGFFFSFSNIPNWVIALLCLAALPSALLLAAFARHMVRGEREITIDWTSYKADDFFHLRWRWHYANGRIVKLNTFCPNCDYQVFARNSSSYDFIDIIEFSCDSCHRDLAEFTESEAQLHSKVERFIQQKIRNDTWRAASAN